MLDELFSIMTKNIHFNATQLNEKTWNQNWRVPEGLISIIGIKNGKKPVFYYGTTNAYKKEYELKKGISPSGNKFINARVYYKFDRQDIIEKEKYVAANAFNGLLLCIKVDKDEFVNITKRMLLEGYKSGDEHIIKVLEFTRDRNMFDTIEESALFIANRDYNWLIGKIKNATRLLRFSGQGYWLLPLKTKLEITPGFVIRGNELIVNLENVELFRNYLVYVDTKEKIVRYNPNRLCNRGVSLVDEVRKMVNENTCPWCGSKLRIVRTKKGEFLGCTNYPNCLYRRFPNKNIE